MPGIPDFLLQLIQQQGNVPSLGNIANQLPMVNPTFPTQPGTDFASLMNQVNQIMGSSTPQPVPPQRGGFGGFLQGLLQAVPQSLGVGLSVLNPQAGGAFLQNLQYQKELQFRREEAERQRRERLEDVKRQIGLKLFERKLEEESEVKKEQRALTTFGKQQEILTKKQKELAVFERAQTDLSREDELAFWDRNQFKLNARKRADVILQMLPEQERTRIKLEEDYGTYAPEFSPQVLNTIAKKRAGILNEPLTKEETNILKKVNLARSESELEFKKAATEEKKAVAEATRSGVRYQSRFLTQEDKTTAGLMSKGIDTLTRRAAGPFVKDANGTIYSVDELSDLDKKINLGPGEKFQPLSPDEENAEKLRRLDEASRGIRQMEQQEKQRKAVQETPSGPTTSGDEIDTAKAIIQKAIAARNGQRPTPDQLRIILKANGISQPGIDSVLSIGPTITDATTKAPSKTTVKASDQTAINIIRGLERQIRDLESQLTFNKNLSPSVQEKLRDLRERLAYARSQHPDIK